MNTTKLKHRLSVLHGLWLAFGVCLGLLLPLSSRADTALWTMGNNELGQLGAGSVETQPTPQQLGPNGTKAIAVGWNHTLYVDSAGALWATGRNVYFGQLGTGDTTNRTTPVKVVPSGVVSVAAGANASMYIDTNGALWAMGDNGYGQLGTGDTNHRTTPTKVVTSGVVAVAGGSGHTVFIDSNGALWAMGNNEYGQFGTGDTTEHHTPVKVVSSGVVSVAAGGENTMYIDTNGALWVVGHNDYSQLGTGDTTDRHTPLKLISSGVVSVSTGGYHTLYITSTGALWGMGLNFVYELGPGTTTTLSMPVKVVSSGVSSASAGTFHSLYITSSGGLHAMGDNYYGQLGVGDSDFHSDIQTVNVGSRTVTAVAAGQTHSTYLTYVPQVGSLKVTLSPQAAITAGAKWSIDGGSTWRSSGTTVSNLAVGTYTVSFNTVAGWNSPSSLSATVSNGATTSKSATYVQQVGSLKVTLAPQAAITAGAKWSIDGGTTWRNSGTTVSNLASGTYTVTFKGVAGWNSPSTVSATVSTGATTSKTATYAQQVGSLKVTLAPQGAIDAGAQWSIDAGATWRDSGATVADLVVGDYTVTFKAVAGWATPANQTATVANGVETTKTGTYEQLAGSLTVTLVPQAAIDAGAQWSIDAGTTWRDSGATVADLPVGDYTVTFKAVAGWTAPSDLTATVANDATTTESATYEQLVRAVSITLAPQGAVDAGAQWSIDGGATWHDSATTVADLPLGSYTVTFKAISNWDVPSSLTVTVEDDAAISETATYGQHVGRLRIMFYPSRVRNQGAQWSIDGGNTWFNDYEVQYDLPIGEYPVTFKAVDGYTTPPDMTVTVGRGNSAPYIYYGTYLQNVTGLLVMIEPEAARSAGAQWSIDGGTTWKSGGEDLMDIAAGDYTISFKPVANWYTPADRTVTVAEGATSSESVTYLPHMGSVSVAITPQLAIDLGAMWSVDAGATWHASGETVGDLPVGLYSIQFSSIHGWTSPASIQATVTLDETLSETGTYVEENGNLIVVMEPAGARVAGAAWSVDGGETWYGPQVAALFREAGDYTVTFKETPGWTRRRTSRHGSMAVPRSPLRGPMCSTSGP